MNQKTQILASITILLGLNGCTGTRPNDLGLKEQSLKACPEKPNCVSSFATSDEHKIAPLALPKPIDEAKTLLKRTISGVSNAELIGESDNYLYYEFTSSIMRYVDDVEFYFTGQNGLVHVRSASRLGYSDMGANRKRIEMIRSRLPK